MLVLLLFAGGSVKAAGEREDPGVARSLLIAIGTPADWLASALPFEEVADDATSVVSPDEAESQPGFSDLAEPGDVGVVAPIETDNFDATDLGEPPADPPPLEKLLVTGDSLSTPMDSEIAKRLTGSGVEVIRDPHLASGISNTAVADWGAISRQQVAEHAPDAVVVFIGANEGYPLDTSDGEVDCCGPAWSAAFARRAREMMDTFRQDGEARVYWMVVPAPRDGDHQEVTHAVNRAVDVATSPWRSHVHLVDLAGVFTPGGVYRDAMDVDGSETIIRDPDGIHLNDRGAEIAAGIVADRLELDYVIGD